MNQQAVYVDPKIIAATITANRNIQRMLNFLVLARMMDAGLTKEQADKALIRLLK